MELRYPCKIVIVYYFLALTDNFISIFFLLKNIKLKKNYEYKFFRTQTCYSKDVSALMLARSSYNWDSSVSSLGHVGCD